MKFFTTIALVLALLLPYPAQANEENPMDCKTGCGHDRAPGQGTGRSKCWVTFVAPEGADALKAQIFDEAGIGLLHNSKGEIAIRGGTPGTTRVSVDCSAIWGGAKAILCFTYAGQDMMFLIVDEKFRSILPRQHRKGGFVFQMPPL